MEKFSLEKYLENPTRKVYTRCGLEAEIIHDKSPLVAIINGMAYNFENDGSFKSNRNASHQYDLFFEYEEELTEFEKELKEVLYEYATTNTSSEEKARQCAPELLNLAKKEVLKSLPEWKKITKNEQKYLAYGYLSYDGYYLSIQELKDKLPKEE